MAGLLPLNAPGNAVANGGPFECNVAYLAASEVMPNFPFHCVSSISSISIQTLYTVIHRMDRMWLLLGPPVCALAGPDFPFVQQLIWQAEFWCIFEGIMVCI